MGKAARRKRGRRVRVTGRQIGMAVLRAMDASPCDTCAFRDPEAWAADLELLRKLRDCVVHRRPFWCHHGFGLGGDEGVEYQPPRLPRGEVDGSKLRACAGFVRLIGTQGHDPARLLERIDRVRRTFVERWLASDNEFARQVRDVVGGDVDLAILALDMTGDKVEPGSRESIDRLMAVLAARRP